MSDPHGAIAHDDQTIVRGMYSRYHCEDIGQVVRHLFGLRAWVDREERIQRNRPALIRRARHAYFHDTDLLLNAYVMLTALGTLDDDCEHLASAAAPRVPVLREPV